MKVELGTPILVKAKIIGQKNFIKIDMVFDTGARYTTLSWAVLKAVGYDPARIEEKTGIVTANGVIEAPILTLKALMIENPENEKEFVKVDGVKVIALDIPELVGVEGLLGLSFLNKTKTTINYKNKILGIEDP